MENFRSLRLPEPLLHCLDRMQFTTPTPIQAQAIPLALNGSDILGSAQTGTGKTGAFALPMLVHLMNNKQSTALIMSPTRELAAQIMATIQKMLPPSAQIKMALLIGGDSMFKQLQQLKARPRIIVGTPGRINDHLEQRTVRFDATDFLVLDETDRMLDMGFDVQIERIIRHLPPKRQTLLFSATLPPHIVKLADKYLKDPKRVAVGSTHTPIEKIQQEIIHIPAAQKYETLIDQLNKRTGSVIVFVKTKHGADRLTRKLLTARHSAEAIHGNLSQSKRTRVIQAFRDKKHRIMVATDVAARGLDIPHIEHVINYDLPQVPEDYIHRIGRTARAGKTGAAVCFITPEDRKLWREIHILMNPGEKTTEDSSSGVRGFSPRDRKSAGGGEKKYKRRPFKGPAGQRVSEDRKERRPPVRDRFEGGGERRRSEGSNAGERDRSPGGARRGGGGFREDSRRSAGGGRKSFGGASQNRGGRSR